ncbi:MAG: hypothetical protein JW737_08155 [Acidobacteria bacterium]|nr:hypothetical protein [Acidobacteriota bacterium]
MKKLTIFVLGVLLIISAGTLRAQALKDSENDPLTYLRTLPRPNILIIADTSGSMGLWVGCDPTDPANKDNKLCGQTLNVRYKTPSYYQSVFQYDGDNPRSRMKTLKDSLAAIVTDVDSVNFGLACFNNYTRWYYYVGSASHEFTANTTLYEYCYQADPYSTMITSDCIYLPKKWCSYESSNYHWANYIDCTGAAAHIQINGKRYASNTSNVSFTAKKGSTYTVHWRTVQEYDPYDNDPPFPPDSYEGTNNWGETLTYTRSYSQAYAANWTAGLDMQYGADLLPHVSVDIRNDADDLDYTDEDEADNTAEMLLATGSWYEDGAFEPGSGTPLDASMKDAYYYFRDNIIPRDDPYPDVKACRKNYVILITDGESSDGAFYDRAQNLYNLLGVKTFGIALSLTNSTEIDQCADAGDDGLLNGTASAYAADNKEKLIEHLKAIMDEISEQVDAMVAPVIATTYSNPWYDAEEEYEGENSASTGVAITPYFQFPAWRGHLLATHLWDVEYNPRKEDDEATADWDERWITYNTDPYVLWDAGFIMAYYPAKPGYSYTVDTNNNTYINSSDELSENPGFHSADDRTIYTAVKSGDTWGLVPFDTTLSDKVSKLGTSSSGVPSHWIDRWDTWYNSTQLASEEEAADVVINYIRGKEPRYDSEDNDGDGSALDYLRDTTTGEILYKEIEWKLGNNVIAAPAVIGPPTGTYKKKYFDDDQVGPEEQTFADYAKDFEDRPQVVIAPLNDGMIHCFALYNIEAGTKWGPEGSEYTAPRDYTAGEEIWAFVPPDETMMKRLQFLAWDANANGMPDGQTYSKMESPNPDRAGTAEWIHWYFVDGPTRYANVIVDRDGDGVREWMTYVIIGEGRGGPYYWAFNMDDPFNPELMYRFPEDASTAYIGVATSTPALAYEKIPGTSDYRWSAWLGSGWDPDDDSSTQIGQHIYGLDVVDGSVIYDYNLHSQDSGTKKLLTPAPAAVLNKRESIYEYVDDAVFIGDTDGHLWRINIDPYRSSGDPDDITVKRLDLETEDQPITNAVTLTNMLADEDAYWNMVFVGTGGDSRIKASEPKHLLVGLIDSASTIPAYPGPTISPSASDDDLKLPAAVPYTTPSAITTTPYVFLNVYMNANEQIDAQTTVNYVALDEYFRVQIFFTIYDNGSNPCVNGTSVTRQIDRRVYYADGSITGQTLDNGSELGETAAASGHSGGTYIADGVLVSASGDTMSIMGDVSPPPSIVAANSVVHILSWKVITD